MLSLWPLCLGLLTAVFVNNLTVMLRCAPSVGEPRSLAVTLPCAHFLSLHKCLMFVTRRSWLHLPQHRRSVAGVFVALLLLLTGVGKREAIIIIFC